MSKVSVAVVTDSTAHIPEELVTRHSIHVIPQILLWGEEKLYEGVDITPTRFYERLRQSSVLPTTSQPSVGEFVDFFTKVAETAESIVGVFIGEHLSGTLASAHGAAEIMTGATIEIIDSRSTSMGLGFAALAAARAAERGLSSAEVAQAAREVVSRVRVIFVVDTLEYLHRGGRIGGAQRLMGSMLSVKPLLHLQDGRIEPLASVRTKGKAVHRMLDQAQEEMRGKSKVHAAVLHAVAAAEAESVAEQVVSRLEPVEMIRAELGPVIGTHVGPGMVGVVYYAEA